MLNEPTDVRDQRLLSRLAIAALPELLTSDDNRNTILKVATVQRKNDLSASGEHFGQGDDLGQPPFQSRENPLKDMRI